MQIEQQHLRDVIRREFFANSGLHIGSLGLASLMSGSSLLATPSRATNLLAVQDTHFPAGELEDGRVAQPRPTLL